MEAEPLTSSSTTSSSGVDTEANLLPYECQICLCHAAIKGYEVVVRRLLDGGANVNSRVGDHSALSWVVSYEYRGVVELLPKNGGDIEAKDNMGGETLLSQASGKGHEVLVKLLVDEGGEGSTSSNSAVQSRQQRPRGCGEAPVQGRRHGSKIHE